MANIHELDLAIDTMVAESSKQSRREADEMRDHLKTLPEKSWLRMSFCTEWTIKDVAEHQTVQGGQMRDAVKHVLRGTPLPDRTPEGRQKAKEALYDLNHLELADKLSEVTHEFYDLLEQATPEQLQRNIPSAVGMISLVNLGSFRLGELSLHSWDVRVVDNLSAKVSRQSLPLMYPGLLAAVPMLADAKALKTSPDSTIQFEIGGSVKGEVAMLIKEGKIISQRGYAEKPDVTLKLDSDVFLRLLWGRLKNLDRRIQDGWVKVNGDMATAIRLNKLFAGFE